jgi:hypothetical protein
MMPPATGISARRGLDFLTTKQTKNTKKDSDKPLARDRCPFLGKLRRRPRVSFVTLWHGEAGPS